MKRSVDLDEELSDEVARTASLVGEKPATILRLAIRAGLPVITNRFQGPRPEGYFADTYRRWPKQRIRFEEAMAEAIAQKPER
jgi:hypothetical protein